LQHQLKLWRFAIGESQTAIDWRTCGYRRLDIKSV
jgi:hypothetical protein